MVIIGTRLTKNKKNKKSKKNKKNKKKKQEKQEKQKEGSEESKFLKYIENKSEGINYLLFNYYFNFLEPSDLAKKLFEIKDKNKNNDFVEVIKNRWSKLKDRTEGVSEEGIENKGLNKMLEIVKEILKFNKQN